MSILDSIPEAIEEIRNGGVIIVVDDEDRENEGDFLTAARNVTPDVINFMATHGRGLVCAPLVESRCDALGLELMVQTNNAAYETPFTVSVDLLGHGCTTEISTSDRSKTIQALIDPNTDPNELGRPGHIFPLRAKSGGVLRRNGHTEAAIDFARLAGFEPAGVIVEILNEDGTMARLPDLLKVAKKFDLKIISIEDLVSYRMKNDSLIEIIDSFNLKTKYGDYTLNTFKQKNNDQVHLALSKGTWSKNEPVLCRVNSFGSINNSIDDLVLREDENIKKITNKIDKENKGVIVFVNQDHETKPILNKINHLKKLQKSGKVFKPYKKMDVKDFGTVSYTHLTLPTKA